MITTVSSATALQSALGAAQAGDTILLKTGVYSGVTITGRHFAQDVTIKSADPNAKATLEGLVISKSDGLNISDLNIRIIPGGERLLVVDSHNIDLARLNVHGSLDGDPQNDTGGLLIRTSSYVTIKDSQFQQLNSGIAHLNSAHVTIEGNRIHDIAMDGVRGAGSSYVTISDNSFTNFYPASGAHPDAIQFWTANTTSSAHDIFISHNEFIRGSGSRIQGIFLNDETGALPYRHVAITDNLIAGAMYHGITVQGAQDVTLTHNVVQGFTDMKSWIRLYHVNHAVETDNYANQYSNSTDTDVYTARNTTIPLASDGGAGALALWEGQTTASMTLVTSTAGEWIA